MNPRPLLRDLYAAPIVLASLLIGPSFRAQEATNVPHHHPSRSAPEGTRPARIEVLDGELAVRYAYADTGVGQVVGRQLEMRSRGVVQLRLDGTGATTLQTRVETGNSFSNSWNETPVGIAQSTSNYNPKTFLLTHRFHKRSMVQAGGIEFERGAGTEATDAANEGWLTGYRAELVPASSIPLRAVTTVGYVGDFAKPDFFPRARRMGTVNYAQQMLVLDLSGHTSGSVAVEGLQGTGYLRGALHAQNFGRDHGVGSHGEYVLESVERLSGYRAFGWSTSLGAAVVPSGRIQLLARYTDLPEPLYRGRDGQQMLLNSGEIGLGRRSAAIANVNLLPGTVFELLVARRLDDVQTTNRWRAFVAIHYNLGAGVKSVLALRGSAR